MARLIRCPGWAVVLLCLGACHAGGENENSAGGVVVRYVRAISRGDVAGALGCVVPAQRAQAEPIVRLGAELASASIRPEGGLDSVTIVRMDTQGDRTQVEFRTRTKRGLERTNRATAVRVEGIWYVAQ